MAEKAYRAVVMGVGNILWADEGFGCRAAEKLHNSYKAPEGVRVIDGGTLGYFLQEFIEETDHLLIFDCCDFHEKPGTLKVITGEDIHPWLSSKMSAHQQGLNDLFAMAMIRGRYPENIAIIGCQPFDMEDYGGSLTKDVAPQVEPAVKQALEILKDWGFEFTPRPSGDVPPPLGEECLVRDRYETERPAEETAPREGDVRFFTSKE